jgi:hypothetical protein
VTVASAHTIGREVLAINREDFASRERFSCDDQRRRLRVTAFPSLLDDSGLAPRVLVARPEVAVRWRF